MDWENTTDEWSAYGLLCRIRPGFASLNGYVQIPPKLFDAETAERVLKVHYGITYGPDDDGWVGFDTAHAGDIWAPDDLIGLIPDEGMRVANSFRDIFRSGPDSRLWTKKALREETERLAQQIAVALDLSTIDMEAE